MVHCRSRSKPNILAVACVPLLGSGVFMLRLRSVVHTCCKHMYVQKFQRMKGMALFPVSRARSIAVLSVSCFKFNSSLGGRAEVLYYTVNAPCVSIFRQRRSFFKHAFHKAEKNWLTTNRSVSTTIIIIYPLTARVVGAPQMISQPVFLRFSLFSTALWDLLNSKPVHSLKLSSHLFLCLLLSSSPFHCALQDGFGQTWWTGDMTIPPVCLLYTSDAATRIRV